jgi:polar amino acid transport system substrate-binding protein
MFRFVLLASLPLLLFSANLTVLTENNFLPYNYIKDGKLEGISVELVEKMLQKCDIKSDITVLPWDRGYSLLKKGPNIALFTTVRSKEREQHFKWVGPLGSINMVFLAKKGFDKPIKSIEDVKKLDAIGLQIEEDYTSEALKKAGFKNLTYSGVNSLNAFYLYTGKIDLWFGTEFQMIEHIKKMNLDPDDFEIVYKAKELGLDIELYVALSKDVDDEIVEKLQSSLDELKRSGEYEEIVARYFQKVSR